MIAGGDKLQSAAEALSDWKGDRAAVQRAAESYWSASWHAPHWPEPLQARHEHISALLFRHGVARDTVARMTDSEVKQLVGELSSFLSDALNDGSV